MSRKHKELSSSYLRKPAKQSSIIVKSLNTSNSEQSLKLSQSSIKTSVVTGSFLLVFFGATLLDASSIEETKVFVVGSFKPLIS